MPAAFVAPLPDAIDAEDAAGVPVAFLTAHYGLNRLAQLRRGQRVLIHAAAGGVGLAAVQLAQRQGAEIFATAGSPEKRELLHSLGVAHVMDSRSLAFADQVLNATAGKGVDVVLNSLAGEFISESMRALADGGCFLELGKRDIWAPETVKEARPDIRYYAYDLGAEVQADRSLLRPMLDEILASFADGSLRPLPVTVFPFAELRDAMRFHGASTPCRQDRAAGRQRSRRSSGREIAVHSPMRRTGSPVAWGHSGVKPRAGWFDVAPSIWCSAVAGRPMPLR